MLLVNTEVAVCRGSVKKMFLKISQNSQENTCIESCRFAGCSFIKKETPIQVLSCEFCEILKNTFFTEDIQTTASGDSKDSFKNEQRSHQKMLYEICDLPIFDKSYEIT